MSSGVLSGNGYITFPNGLIMQWGQLTNRGVATTYVTFPIAFPNQAYNLQTSYEVSNGRGSYSAGDRLTQYGAFISTDHANTWWVALGR